MTQTAAEAAWARLWRRGVGLGVDASTAPAVVKRIMLVNGLTLVIGLVAVAWIGVGLVVSAEAIVWIGGAQLLGFAPVLALNHRRRHAAAIGWLLGFGMLILWLIAERYGARTGAQHMLLSGIIFAFLAFPAEQRLLSWGFGVATGALWWWTTSHTFASPPPDSLPDHWLLDAASASAVLGVYGAIGWWAQRSTATAEQLLERERQRSEALLLNILPPAIALRLKADEQTIADGYEQVTVLFSDLVGFTPLSATVSPRELVAILDEIVRAFDTLCDEFGLEKIKTIGDAYMVAAGLPTPRPDHADAVAAFALRMCETLAAIEARHQRGLQLRVGVHTGPIVAGVIGHRKFAYDLWGDTVNVAARMESHGIPGRVQISAATREALGDRFVVEERGTIEVKGKGAMAAFLLVGRA